MCSKRSGRTRHFLAVALVLTCGFAQAQSSDAPGEANAATPPGPEGVILATHSATGFLPVKSWKRLRDDRVVKQDLDYSCGAASLATLLNGYYGQNVSEAALLKAMDKGDGRASFEDMAHALTAFGFKAQGFAASWEQLARLRMPVIVYLKHRKDDHFSVLRGIDGETVWLADPSLGNRSYSRQQFEAMWNTRGGELAGKFLAVLPLQADLVSARDFFTRNPRRESAAAVAQLAHRATP